MPSNYFNLQIVVFTTVFLRMRHVWHNQRLGQSKLITFSVMLSVSTITTRAWNFIPPSEDIFTSYYALCLKCNLFRKTGVLEKLYRPVHSSNELYTSQYNAAFHMESASSISSPEKLSLHQQHYVPFLGDSQGK